VLAIPLTPFVDPSTCHSLSDIRKQSAKQKKISGLMLNKIPYERPKGLPAPTEAGPIDSAWLVPLAGVAFMLATALVAAAFGMGAGAPIKR